MYDWQAIDPTAHDAFHVALDHDMMYVRWDVLGEPFLHFFEHGVFPRICRATASTTGRLTQLLARMKVPTTYDLKPAFSTCFCLLGRLRQAGVTPNTLTWMAILLSGGLGYAFVLGLEQRGWFYAVAAGLLLRMALNALDGMMARQFSMTSKAGAVLNELGDVVSDALVMWPLALLPGVHPGWVGRCFGCRR